MHVSSYDLTPGISMPFHSFLLPGTDKEEKTYEKYKTSCRNPPVKCSLTDLQFSFLLLSLSGFGIRVMVTL